MAQLLKNDWVLTQAKLSGMDASGEQISFRFTAPKTGTISTLFIYIPSIVGTSPTYRFGVQTDNGGGKPSGSYIQSATFSGWVAGVYHNLGGFTIPVTAAQVYHFVLRYESGTVNSSNFINVGWGQPPYQKTPTQLAADTRFAVLFSTDSGSNWEEFSGHPVFVAGYSDSTAYGNPYGQIRANTITDTNWVRQRIPIDTDITIASIRLRAQRSSSDPLYHQLIAEIWDSSDTVLATKAISDGSGLTGPSGFSNLHTWIGATLDRPLTLKSSVGQYWLVVKCGVAAQGGEADYGVESSDTTNSDPARVASFGGKAEGYMQVTTDSGGAWSDQLYDDLVYELVPPATPIIPFVRTRLPKQKKYMFLVESKNGKFLEANETWDFDSITRQVNGSMSAQITTTKTLATLGDGVAAVPNNVTIRVATDKTGPDGVDYFSGYVPQRSIVAGGGKESVVLKAFGHLSKLYRAVWRTGTSIVHDYTAAGSLVSTILKAILDDYRAIDTKAKISYVAASSGQAVVNPNAHPETATVDGIAARDGVNETFATIRAGSGNLSDDSSGTTTFVQVTCSATTNQFSSIVRSGLLFDTSAIPVGSTIVSADLDVFPPSGGRIETLAGQSLVLVSFSPASNTAVVSADYGNFGTTALSATKTISSFTLNAYNTIPLTSPSAITAGGITKLGVRMECDRSGAAPTWGSGNRSAMDIQFAEGTNKPTLTVTYSQGGVTDTIEATATTVRQKFELMTYGEALEKVAGMAYQAGRPYHFTVLGDNVFRFKRASAAADHVFIFGKDLSELRVDEDLINAGNEVFLYHDESAVRRYRNDTLIDTYDYLSEVRRETNVPDATTADAIGNALLNESSPPVLKVTARVSDRYHRGIEFINPGDTCRVLNVPVSLEELLSDNMLITRTVYHKDWVDLELSIKHPRLESEVERLRRGFEQSRTEGSPTTFTNA